MLFRGVLENGGSLEADSPNPSRLLAATVVAKLHTFFDEPQRAERVQISTDGSPGVMSALLADVMKQLLCCCATLQWCE